MSNWWRKYVARIRKAARRVTTPTELRLVTHNVKVGRRPAAVVAAVRELIHDTRAHVLTLQEAGGYVGVLRSIPGYQVFAEKGWPESDNCVTLVRNDRDAKRRRPIRCRTPWRGPKHGKHHAGRTYPVTDVDGLWRIINVHRTRPGWSRDAAAFREENTKLSRRLRLTLTRLRKVIVGDQNTGTRPGSDRGKWTPWALAKSIGAKIASARPGGVDYAIVTGADVEDVEELGSYGSDHPAVLITLTAR